MSPTLSAVAARTGSARKNALGYVRVSDPRQEQGYSPETQRASIAAYAERMGWNLVATLEDAYTGTTAAREAYQELIALVNGGVIDFVIVHKWDRWGRDASEYLRQATVMDRRDVEFHSASDGKDEAGIVRTIRAGLAEEQVRNLAKTVHPNLERSARAGNHIGITPFGYRRAYPPREAGRRYIRGLLTAQEPQASLVRTLFRRYAAGETMRDLAIWLNSDPACPRTNGGGDWSQPRLSRLLGNPVYAGKVRYFRTRLGKFVRSAPGSEFVADGVHDALVDQQTFDAVQARLRAPLGTPAKPRRKNPLSPASQVLVCASCGGPMTHKRRSATPHAHDSYMCAATLGGKVSGCAPGFPAHVGHAALLGEVARLGVAGDWHLDRLDAALRCDPVIERRRALQAAYDAANAKLSRHMRVWEETYDAPSKAEIDYHRARMAELGGAADQAEAALAGLPPASIDRADLARLVEVVRAGDFSRHVAMLAQPGFEAQLRTFVTTLVARAWAVDRQPASHPRWVALEVTWTAEVTILLEAGVFFLAPQAPRPDLAAAAAAHRRDYERARKARARATRA